ncbi:MAG: HlyC/CorC family transporter [Spirochaetales bacterium]|nr:HlyC/CorC family transporter [Spirochaetales bacterium]
MIYAGIFICMIASGFFAGNETGLLAADQLSLFSKKEKGIFYATAAHFLLIKPERLLSTTLIGTNISVVTAAVFLKSMLADFGFPFWASWVGSLGLSVLLLIFSEIIPKSFFREHANTISVKLAPVIAFFYFLFLPVSIILNAIVKFLLIIFRQKRMRRLPHSREDLRLLISLISRESHTDLKQQRIIDDIFDFKETIAREVMVPFFKVPVIAYDEKINDIIRQSQQEHIRYYAVFSGRTDNIIGYIDVMDLLSVQAQSVGDIMKKAYFYPDTKRIHELLCAMIERKQIIVFLSDEYGGISGKISQDDIAAEIVGYIPKDKYNEIDDIKEISKNVYHIAGTTNIEDLYNETSVRIEKGEYDTIGGYICTKLGEIPEKGGIYKDKGLDFTILERDDRHIILIEMRIHKT